MQTRLALFNADGVEILPGDLLTNFIGRPRKLVKVKTIDTIEVNSGRKSFDTYVDHYPNLHIREVQQFTTAKEMMDAVPHRDIASLTAVMSTPNSLLYTPLATALLAFFDAGYTAHRVFDHDRSTVRSVTFKRADRVALTAHVEIIDGERYIRNSVLKHIEDLRR